MRKWIPDGGDRFGSVRFDAVAINKMLDASCRRDVHFFVIFDQFECRAEFAVQRICVVLDHRKTAAFRGPVRSESSDDHVPARLHRAHDLSDIRAKVGLAREKVKYGPVVPDIEEPFWQWRGSDI